MVIDEAIRQISRWCDESNGAPIEIAQGRVLAFASHATFGNAELLGIEQRLSLELPSSYRQFMNLVGQSILFRGPPPYGAGGIHFFTPDEAVNASLNIWAEELDPVSDRFCFVGWHGSMGDYFGFAIDRHGPKNFDVFCHEYPPSEYVAVSNELGSWRTFDEWIIHAVETYGVDTL